MRSALLSSLNQLLHPVPSSFLPHRVDQTDLRVRRSPDAPDTPSKQRTHRTARAASARAHALALHQSTREREHSLAKTPPRNNQAAAARVPHVPPLAPHHEADATHDTRDLTRLTNRPPEPISVRETPCMRETIACSMSMHTPRATRRAPRTNIAKARLRNQKRDSSTAGGWPPCTHIE